MQTHINLFKQNNDHTRIIRKVQFCSSLTEKLQTTGFMLKRSSAYLQLIPQCNDTTEWQQHKKVANIKLCKAQYKEKKKNHDCLLQPQGSTSRT